MWVSVTADVVDHNVYLHGDFVFLYGDYVLLEVFFWQTHATVQEFWDTCTFYLIASYIILLLVIDGALRSGGNNVVLLETAEDNGDIRLHGWPVFGRCDHITEEFEA